MAREFVAELEELQAADAKAFVRCPARLLDVFALLVPCTLIAPNAHHFRKTFR